jgi:GR25 family glycosyltransferase involved in LPS biosynthesis
LRTLNLDFEVIPAINGYALSDNEKNSLCDMSAVAKYRSWLSDGIIGCSLSHRKALLRMIELNLPYVLILEDDVVLPNNFNDVLSHLGNIIQPDGVITLFSGAHQKTALSKTNSINTPFGGLYFPMNINETLSTAAYIIGKDAAKKLSEAVLPVRASPDSWGMYYSLKTFSSFRVLYPFIIGNKAFKSTVAYIHPKSFLGRITFFINKYKFPGLYHILKARREKIIDDTTANFYLCDEKSPIDKN